MTSSEPKKAGFDRRDLSGFSRLTLDAVSGVTELVEELHQTILSSPAGQADQGRTKGITGLVYRNIRTLTGWLGEGLDALFQRLGSNGGEREISPGREAVVAALNGVLGDHLKAQGNPLAVPMRFRRDGRPLGPQGLDETLGKAAEKAEGGLLVLVHGLCMNDLQWCRKGHDHGRALARDLGLTRLYLHYNSGLHISENGRKLADLLEGLMARSAPPKTLVILGHSMGGLVSRSACFYGKTSGHRWLKRLRKLIFLGTPHHGAPLEKGGHWVDLLLGISPYSAPFTRLSQIRSAGITDLRYGNVRDEDWQGSDRFEGSGDRRLPLPLPEGVRCYAVAAVKAEDSGRHNLDLVGDGLVPLNSALGRHSRAEFELVFPETRRWVGHHLNHLDLLNDRAVYDTLHGWLDTE